MTKKFIKQLEHTRCKKDDKKEEKRHTRNGKIYVYLHINQHHS